MKLRSVVAITLAAGLVLSSAACSDSDDEKELTVWLMDNSLPKSLVDDVVKDFESDHKDWDVKVEYQQWENIGQTLDKGLGSNNPPDVVEIGNTLNAGLSAAGALEDLTDKESDLNGADWLPAMKESGTYKGKIYGIPYYGGSRVVLYRKDLFANAGVQVPTTYDELVAASGTLAEANASVDGFNPFYVPGRYWYLGTNFVENSGGSIATEEGDTWTSQLSSGPSIAGLNAYKTFADTVSPTSPKEATEEDPPQINVMADGKTAMLYGFGWQVPLIEEAKNNALKDQIGIFALPGASADVAFPSFAGGSNLGIAANSDKKDEAYDFVKLLAVNYQEKLVTEAKLLPNSNTMLDVAKQDPALAPSAMAFGSGWFVPTSPQWSEVESTQVMQDLFQAVTSGSKTPEQAASDADAKINEILND